MIRRESKTLGGLRCQVLDALDEDEKPRLVVVLCHGFGAPGTDLVSIGSVMFTVDPSLAKSVRFVFPAAPLSLDKYGMYGGRAWWMIDMELLMGDPESDAFRRLRSDVPNGLPEARQSLLALIGDVQTETGLPLSQIVLGGFSQGAMLTADVTFHLPESPAALCLWSGTLLCEDVWKELAPNRSGLAVLQSHGRQDPLLPFDAAISLRELLTNAGLAVDFLDFPGMHEIPREALDRFAKHLQPHVST